jgi:hypothetical protein
MCLWVPPITCSGIYPINLASRKGLSCFRFLWQNSSMPRWLPPLITITLGIALGLLFGWVLDPVKFVDTTPASLRSDFRTDYVLMVAESFHSDRNAGLAARRLAIFGSDSPAVIAGQALQTGRDSSYSQGDISLLQELSRAMQALQPAPTPAGSIPGTPAP